MNGFTLITLRWYHGGVLDLSSGEPIYNGGKVTEFLDVDVDKMSYFELKDYIRELGYSTSCTFSIKAPNSGLLVDVDNDKDILDMMCSLEDGDEVESENFNFGVGEDHLNNEDPVATFSTSPSFTTTPHFTATSPFNIATADGATADVLLMMI
ncbi:hypothetical protein R3W88_033173 [Solanum pinnatisectum]|uniref:PB1-like domain-containing protein n=1 Tax=Solanum pinnatisectum TaxID=50273 RepID=A0AAV9K209_9SOLN|nr:hypothetical protein R3W88_033173 [Solanum pinnatisectum]